MLFVIMSPSGPYFPTGFKPITLLAEYEAVRSWPGGTGAYKLGINYAPCFKPQREAAKKGYQQILWILGEDRRITEVGQMNFFIVVKRSDGGMYWRYRVALLSVDKMGSYLDVGLLTPPLDGTILPGVTRDSVLALATLLHTNPSLAPYSSTPNFPKKIHAQEVRITMPQLLELHKSGSLLEAFGVGTAAVLAPVERIGYEGEDLILPAYEDGLGPIGRAMYDSIVAIQEGRAECEDWSVVCS